MSTKLSLKSATEGKKINSPLAKYNSIGQLFCVVCNAQVKNEMYWTGHISGKAHRDQLLILKSKGSAAAASKRPASSSTPSGTGEGNGVSSSSSSNSKASEAKRYKTESTAADSFSSMGPPRSILKQQQQPKPSPSQKMIKDVEEEHNQMEVDSSSSSINNSSEAVATRSFDEGIIADSSKEARAVSQQDKPATDSLPAGFFDDAKEDAKARGIDYRNPEEAEWDMFMKEIATEEVKSSVMRTVDEEESAKDRELNEIEEQMKNWQRVIELERKAKETKLRHMEQESSQLKMKKSEEDDDEEIDYEEELDWRSKKY